MERAQDRVQQHQVWVILALGHHVLLSGNWFAESARGEFIAFEIKSRRDQLLFYLLVSVRDETLDGCSSRFIMQ
jgi:hypothetical protein